jgi:mono/diheme cytochrome c family protein
MTMISHFARPLGRTAAVSAFTAFATAGALADSAGATFSQGDKFTEQTGEALYANVCQACHMEEGQGAVGAGRYPPLAKDKNLEAGGYPVTVVLHGLNAMPPVGQMMSDGQVAAVVNYVRTHFGNNYTDPVTVQNVIDQR